MRTVRAVASGMALLALAACGGDSGGATSRAAWTKAHGPALDALQADLGEARTTLSSLQRPNILGSCTALRDSLDEARKGLPVPDQQSNTSLRSAIHYEGQGQPSPGMRMYVVDGTPGGTAEWFEGKADGNRFTFTSASGKATIDGSTFEADQAGSTVEGFVRSATGEMFRFKHNDLTRRLNYSRQGGQADRYTAIITRQSTEVVGRGGDVRQGRPSENIIALDLAASPVPTPGVYYGRVALTTDKLAFDINSVNGQRTLRAYVSDAEPEPAGDIEWFTSPVTGNTFSLTSASGKAKIEGTIADDGVSGTLTLPDQPARRYYAGPAGEGAGIYDVTVNEDRSHTGTSFEGAKLNLTYKEGMVIGKVTDPTGASVDLLGADLTHAYKLGVEGSLPGTYVAFAPPRGRFLIGRNGNVRGGSAGLNIIGLDKKC